jgi:uncharacterized protein YndB with AHSA1/START domain
VSASLDSLLVRAPLGAVYRTLTDVDGWPLWWSRCRTSRAPGTAAVGTEGDRHHLVLGGGWVRRPSRTLARVHGWRHDLGMHVEFYDLRGGTMANVEWWLEDVPDGTLVCLAFRDGRPERIARALRRELTRGMQDLKDHLELAVALALGRAP